MSISTRYVVAASVLVAVSSLVLGSALLLMGIDDALTGYQRQAVTSAKLTAQAVDDEGPEILSTIIGDESPIAAAALYGDDFELTYIVSQPGAERVLPDAGQVAATVAAAGRLAPRETADGPATGSSIIARDDGNGYLAVALDPNPLDKNVRDLMIAGLTVILLMSALAAGLAALLVRRLARPLIALVQATQDLEAGAYDPIVLEQAAARGDEVGVLARRFDRMADQVQQRQRALEQRVASLEVEIDQAQREQSVQRITGSRSFADIQARAARLRERRSGLEERTSVRPQDTEEGRA